ncbi:hypothetical protein IW140_002589 [Coemansia sp. RSA 1813]|nr:hypothetical protein EV178_002083 [Coemansia sp. RSA 1646]KAJ1772713.1 hypothetical protein LPJ74_001239 [Coemansia sp. RSA 1843]KAJ2216132.1 hypothetical protein EV179_001592 [Coemansia sp. RSA 487]KAJ2570119.1 hypothetical protein IW140_002589 [Coemansia sp. RSA 1813]
MSETEHFKHLRELLHGLSKWQPWNRTLTEISDDLGVDPSHGLGGSDADARHAHLGPNIPVDLGERLGFLSVLVEEATEPMMLLLLAVGVLYSLWGEPWDAATIFIAIAAVIGLEVFTEWRAKRALVSLRNSVPVNTSVMRGGNECIVSADELVPGDVITLSQGQSVPADAVVVVCHGFSVDESMLTGESISTYKSPLSSSAGGRNNAASQHVQDINQLSIPQALVCAGTTVASGRAVAMVVATGKYTQIAQNIVQLMRGSKPPLTPSQKRMKQLAKSLSIAAIVVCTVITLLGLAQGIHWRTAILMGMSLAFATIPEEMPLIAKASLALGSQALARHGLLVRKLSTADSLSAVSVIVTDKTGTLTRNKLIVSSIMTVGSAGSDGMSVEVITPEAAAASGRSAALAAPLYAVWSLSVDPLESRPLVLLLESIRRKSNGFASSAVAKATSASMHGFGKDFMNSAVLRSLTGANECNNDENSDITDLPKDPDTDTIPVLTIVEAISLICERLPEPSGELPFDASLRVSARTRSAATASTSFAPCTKDSTNGTASGSTTDGSPLATKDFSAQSLPQTATLSSAAHDATKPKHWTVFKGAPETLVPRCSHVWSTTNAELALSADDISTGNTPSVQPMSDTFAQNISRSATDLAVGGNRIIAYAIAITDQPLFSGSVSEPRVKAKSTKKDGFVERAHRFVEPQGSDSRSSHPGTHTVAEPAQSQHFPSDMIFIGAFAFYDPPQREARPVLQECQDAGIRVIVATGDHPSTALAVANAVGITECHSPQTANEERVGYRGNPARPVADRVQLGGSSARPRSSSDLLIDETAIPQSYGALSTRSGSQTPFHHPRYNINSGAANVASLGNEIHAITGDMIEHSIANGTFDQIIDESNVFARVTPAQKLRLVRSLQARGEVVAFIGDGINDAPPLTRADVGICMGGNPSTADVAMDSASLIVLSGKFSGVVRSLRQGYRLSANMEKCMEFYIACKIAIVLLFAFLLFAEGASPMTPVQVIFIELYVDLGATWTFLTERPEGIVRGGGDSEIEASLTAQTRVRKATLTGSSDVGFLGGDKSTDRAVIAYGLALFATCILPLLVPSLLLPHWAVAPIAPTLTFFTWMSAHVLLGMSMQTQVVPLRVHCARGGRAGLNIPGIVWAVCSLLAVVVSAAIPPVSAHLGIVPLNVVEWIMVAVSPLLLFAALELIKEVRFSKYKRLYFQQRPAYAYDDGE